MTARVMVNGVERDATAEEIAQMEADAAHVPVPRAVTALQFMLALQAAGKLTDAETAVAGASDAVKITWARMTIAERADATLVSMAGGLGMSSEDIDALFIAAAALS